MIRHQRQKHDWGINAEGSSLEGEYLAWPTTVQRGNYKFLTKLARTWAVWYFPEHPA